MCVCGREWSKGLCQDFVLTLMFLTTRCDFGMCNEYDILRVVMLTRAPSLGLILIGYVDHFPEPVYLIPDTKLAVVPKHGDRIAICEFHESIMTWSFLTNSVTANKKYAIHLSRVTGTSSSEMRGGGGEEIGDHTCPVYCLNLS